MKTRSNTIRHLSYIYGIAISLFVMILFYIWFGVANRSIVFLYDHDMGPLFPSTGPFSFVTRSRYFMTGLVASGAVMIIYFVINAALHLLRKTYKPPPWQAVWAISSICLMVGIPTITMTTRISPRLPMGLALGTATLTIGTLALSLQPGTIAGHKPMAVMFLSFDGLALTCIMIGATGIEHIQEWLDRGAQFYVFYMLAQLLLGIAILLVMTGLQYWMKRPPDSPLSLFLAGWCVAYPGMSIIHHLLFTDGYFYITDSDNFFARNLTLQFGIWVVGWFVCVGIHKLREIPAKKASRQK